MLESVALPLVIRSSGRRPTRAFCQRRGQSAKRKVQSAEVNQAWKCPQLLASDTSCCCLRSALSLLPCALHFVLSTPILTSPMEPDTKQEYQEAYESWQRQLSGLHAVFLEGNRLDPVRLKGLLNRESRAKRR